MSIPVSTAMISPMTTRRKAFEVLVRAAATTRCICSKEPVEVMPSPVNAWVSALASSMRPWHSGMAKFDAIQPNTSRGATSPMP